MSFLHRIAARFAMGTRILLRANRGALQNTVGGWRCCIYITEKLHAFFADFSPNPPQFGKTIETPCPNANGAAVAGTNTMPKGFGGGSNIHGHCPSENRHNDRRRRRAAERAALRKSPLLIVLFSPRPLCPNDLQRRSCSCCPHARPLPAPSTSR